MATFQETFEQSVAASLGRQLAFGDFLSDRRWAINIPTGIATFGDDLKYSIQLLGTQSDLDDTWMWSWANDQSNLPPSLLASAEFIRGYGQEEGIPEFTDPHFALESVSGHMLAMACSELCGRHCYYRGPYDGGALFFLVMDTPPELSATVRPERAVTVLTEVISQFELRHRPMAQAFLTGQGLDVADSGRDLTATWPDGNQLCVRFDDSGLILDMNATVNPGQEAKTPWWKRIF